MELKGLRKKKKKVWYVVVMVVVCVCVCVCVCVYTHVCTHVCVCVCVCVCIGGYFWDAFVSWCFQHFLFKSLWAEKLNSFLHTHTHTHYRMEREKQHKWLDYFPPKKYWIIFLFFCGHTTNQTSKCYTLNQNKHHKNIHSKCG